MTRAGRADMTRAGCATLALLVAISAAPAALSSEDAAASAWQAAFAARLEQQVEARLRLLPEADDVLARAAAPCAASIAPIRPRAFRHEAPLLIGLPGGRVLVSTGLIAALESDAELVSLLAHEAGHVERADMLDRLTKAYGAARLQAIAVGGESPALAGMAANVAAGGLMVRHGSQAETAAEDAARRAGCEGGLPVVLVRAVGEKRARRQDRQAHPVSRLGASAFPGASDASVDLLVALRKATAPLP